MSQLSNLEFARLIDHTLLTPQATRKDIEKLCAEARTNGFFGVCVNGSRVLHAGHFLEDSGLKITCAIGHPLGAADADAKRYETEVAVDHGAHVIEVTANLGRLKDGENAYLLRELRDVVEAADERPVSVAFDSGLLNPEELLRLCEIVVESGAKGLSVSDSQGATFLLLAVKQVHEIVGAKFGLKAVGPFANWREVDLLINAGPNRLGTADGASLLQFLSSSGASN